MQYGDDTLLISKTIETAAKSIVGNDVHEKLWTEQQVFDVAKQCRIQTYALSPSPLQDFTAHAQREGAEIFIFYNNQMNEDEIRVHVLGELAAAIAMRDFPDRCRLELGYTERIAQEMRQSVSVIADIIRSDSVRLAA